MAELTPIEVRPATPGEDLLSLRVELELQCMRAESLSERLKAPKRNNVPWIVGGCLLGLMMMISFAWQALQTFVDVMMERAAWDHQENMAALKALAAPAAKSSEQGDFFVVGAMVALAGFCIIIGVLRGGS